MQRGLPGWLPVWKETGMRLAEMMALRQRIGAGVLVTLTRRCPLHCAHCSATATARGEQLDAHALLGLLATFTAECRPEVLLLTGGEPLTRPELVIEAARTARAAGTRTAVLSGAFFARRDPDSPMVRRVARAVDHFSLSLDVFHEREVPRADVFVALRVLLRLGVATSLHIVGDERYLAEVTRHVTGTFGADVPMLVSGLRPVGRAAAWLRSKTQPDAGDAVEPCAMAAWPVITVDGAITACCNQDVVDGRARPEHLVLGRLATTTWPRLCERASNTPLLRMIRTVGPAHLATSAGCAVGDYCTTCHRLGAAPDAVAWAAGVGGGAVGELLQSLALRRAEDEGAIALVRRHGGGDYAHLIQPRGA
jgi:pyruvate-formate lyase-activating enzyme